jgi:hypothetical protein
MADLDRNSIEVEKVQVPVSSAIGNCPTKPRYGLKSTEFPCYRDHGAMKTSYRTRRQTSERTGPEPRLFASPTPGFLIYGSAIKTSPKPAKINDI